MHSVLVLGASGLIGSHLIDLLKEDTGVINACKKKIQEQTAVLHNDRKFRSVVVIPDVDTM